MEMNMMTDTEDANDKKEFDEHELKSAVDTLLKAKEIEADPDLMAAIAPMIAKKHQAIKKISSIKQLRSVAKDKIKELGSKED